MWRTPFRQTTRRNQRTSGDESVDIGCCLVEWGELGNRSAMGGDEGTFTCRSPAHCVGERTSQLSYSYCVHVCTQSDL